MNSGNKLPQQRSGLTQQHYGQVGNYSEGHIIVLALVWVSMLELRRVLVGCGIREALAYVSCTHLLP